MGEADDLAIVQGQDQTGGIEVEFGENVLFQNIGSRQNDSPAFGESLVPDPDEAGRVVIAEGAVVDHCGCTPVLYILPNDLARRVVWRSL